jgi:hypothetical protein
MIRTRRLAGAVTVAASVSLLLAGCGAASSGAAPAAAGGTPSSSPSVDPNAPETNPAGDIPDNQAFVSWSPTAGGFAIKVPEGWSRTDSGTTTVFTDKLNTITVEVTKSANAPTVNSVTTQVAATKAKSTGWVDGSVTAVTRPAGDVILATYQADAPPDPVTGKVVNDDVEQYVFWKNGTTVTLTLSGPHGADNVDPWRIVTDSMSWS